MRKLAFLLALALPVVATPRPAHAKLRVVTSIETFADLARKIGGDRVAVDSLSRGYEDPHFVQAKPSLIVALNRADLLIFVGLELEIGWLPPLVLAARNEKIQLGAPGSLDVSTAIPVLDVPAVKIDRSLGDIHPMGNPHYWIPPDNGERIAKAIAERLRQVDPDGAAAYDARLRAFLDELARRRAGWELKAAPLRGQKIVTYHKSWSYVSRWLGLEEIGYVEPKPGIPAPPSHIAALIGVMKRNGVRVLLMESFYPRNTVQLVGEKSGARLLVLPSDVGARPEITDYFALVDDVVRQLSGAVK
jgi:zinc/manganese transport system substrate-binding protein